MIAVAFLILSLVVLFAVYAWTDLGELMAEQVRLDELWADEVGGSRATTVLEAGCCSLNSGRTGSRQHATTYDWARDGDWAA